MDSDTHTYMMEITRCIEINENDKSNTLVFAIDGCTSPWDRNKKRSFMGEDDNLVLSIQFW